MTVIKPSLRSYISGEYAQLSNKIATYLQSSSLAQGSTRRALEEDEGKRLRKRCSVCKDFHEGRNYPERNEKVSERGRRWEGGSRRGVKPARCSTAPEGATSTKGKRTWECEARRFDGRELGGELTFGDGSTGGDKAGVEQIAVRNHYN